MPKSARLLLLFSFSVAGCATPGDYGRDAGRRPDAPSGLDAGPRPDAPGPDGGAPPPIDGGSDDGGTIPEADTGIAEDVGVAPIDAPVTVDAGPRPDAPGDPCAGVSCTIFDGPCSTGVCNPTTGACQLVPRMDGLACDDGNACTGGDSCVAGACRSGGPVDCSAMSTACTVGMCSASSGGCVAMNRADGTACGGGSCGTGACMAGSCVTSGVADCASCGGGSYCVGGTCGPSPTTLTYDFESGTLPTGWMNGVGGTTGWTVGTGERHAGSYGARSGAIGHSGQSRMSFTLTLASAASIRFWLMTSSESGWDFLRFYVDGVERGTWSGATAWTEAAFDVAAGSHTFEWRYTKDASAVAGSDLVAIDDVTIGPPVGGSTGFEGTTLPAGYSTSGSLPWVTDTTTPHGGARAAASGAIGHSATSSMTRTITLPAATTLTYWYRVSTEANYDYLRVFVDGAMTGQWSGTVAWTMASHALAAGTHTIEWRYSKDASAVGGSDRVWIDDVDFGPAAPGGPLCGP